MFLKQGLFRPFWIVAVLIVSSLSTVTTKEEEKWNKCDQLDGMRNERINCTSGKVSCNEGWSGDLCNSAICREGCHSVHGYCSQPGECKCALGWRGKDCDECVPLPGCKHGSCNKTSYECNCKEGWDGNYCSIPVCREGCHSSRGYCKFPNECRCRIGWGGDTCEECKSLPGCQNGYCTKPLECRCREGWMGLLCDTPVCRGNCSVDNGFCLKPGECRCEVGWWGQNCDTCFPYPGCKHGTCNSPWECNCELGWKGFLCDQKNETGESFCERNPGTCLNGGTCLNVPDDRNYTCSCPALFTGEQCDYLVYSRASIFPVFSRGSSGSRSTFSSTHFPSTSTSTTTTTPTTTTTTTTTTTPPPITTTTTTNPSSSIPPPPSSTEDSSSMEDDNPPLSFSVSTSVSISSPSPVEGGRARALPIPYGEREAPEEAPPFPSGVLDDKSKKYLERRAQAKTSSKQGRRPAKTAAGPFSSRVLPGRGGHLFRGAKGGSRARSRKTPPPILLLELSEPTLDFGGNPLTDTDAHSPQANSISRKRRPRAHVASSPPTSRERTGQQSSFFPFREVRLVSQDRPPRPSLLRVSPSFALHSFPQEEPSQSAHAAHAFHSFRALHSDFSDLPPQTRVNRRTLLGGGFSPHEDHELTEASVAQERQDPPGRNSYYEEYYDGRVHIGDVTEVDKHAPREEILGAYIELKKLIS